MTIGRVLCCLGFHKWMRPNVWAREVCQRCGKKAPLGTIDRWLPK